MRRRLNLMVRYVAMRWLGLKPVVLRISRQDMTDAVREARRRRRAAAAAGLVGDIELSTQTIRARVHWWATREDVYAAAAALQLHTNRRMSRLGFGVKYHIAVKRDAVEGMD